MRVVISLVFSVIFVSKLVRVVCKFKVLEIVKLPSVIVGCFSANAVCNPLVLAIVKLPSVMVACFPSNDVSTFPIFGMVNEV